MPVQEHGAQRASSNAVTSPDRDRPGRGPRGRPRSDGDTSTGAAATAMKVVIVVGPVGSQHVRLQGPAPSATRARLARTGHRSPRSTARTPRGPRSRPPPRAPTCSSTSATAMAGPARTARSPRHAKDGLGPERARPAAGNYNTKYWGEYYIARDIDLAPNAVVILNRLCYASGNSEWGRANPTKTTAMKRVDNYGAGFLRAGARAVFAHAIESASPHHPGAVHVEPDDGLHLHGPPGGQRCTRLQVRRRRGPTGCAPTWTRRVPASTGGR